MEMDFTWTTRAEKLLVVAYWWDQQHGLCCICSEKMEPYHRDAGRNPNAASIEHLIPRRENGPNTAGNVRLAHRSCNNEMGALWAENQHRASKGLPLLTDRKAVKKPRRAKYEPLPLFTENSWFPKESGYYKRWTEWKRQQEKKLGGVDWNAGKALSLPRGATLIPEYLDKIVAKGPDARTRMNAKAAADQVRAKRMTPLETARWLTQQGIRGGGHARHDEGH